MGLLNADKRQKGAKPDSLNAAHDASGSERRTASLEAAVATGRRAAGCLVGVCDSGETQTRRPAWFLPALSVIGSPLGTEGFQGARPSGQRVGWLLSRPDAAQPPSCESQP